MQQALGDSDAEIDSDARKSFTEPMRHPGELKIALEPASSGLLAEIAESIGGVPRVLLRDTDIDTGPGPMLKPSSPEMPERSAQAREVPALRRDRPRGDGRGAPRPGRGPGPGAGGEGALGGPQRQTGAGQAVCRGGPDRWTVATSGNRAGVRAGGLGRPAAVFHHEAGERADIGGAFGRARCSPRRTGSPTPTLSHNGARERRIPPAWWGRLHAVEQ